MMSKTSSVSFKASLRRLVVNVFAVPSQKEMQVNLTEQENRDGADSSGETQWLADGIRVEQMQ